MRSAYAALVREPLPERIEWRVRTRVRRAVLAVAGRPIYCASCGRELFVALPFTRRGRLRVVGAKGRNVRVSFDGEDSLQFRHLELDACPTPERPWLS
jgi:hypothetical protein